VTNGDTIFTNNDNDAERVGLPVRGCALLYCIRTRAQPDERYEWSFDISTLSRVFFLQLTYQMATFTSFSSVTSLPPWLAASLFTPLVRKECAALGVGRWQHHAACRTASACVRVCASVYMCILPWVTARGRLAEIDPIPQL
jgi:hypothetical protein